MSQRPVPSSSSMLLALLGGAALGAVTMALITPKSGKEVRDQFRILGNRIRSRFQADDESDDDRVDMHFI